MFRLGTRYIKLFIESNYSQSTNTELQFTNLSFKEAGSTTTDSSGNGNTGNVQNAMWCGGKV
jgi:hypothetical protein